MTLSKADKFWRDMDRLDDVHGSCDGMISVHTPGMFDEGPEFGNGTAISACEGCLADRVPGFVRVFGVAHVRRRGPDRRLLKEYEEVWA